MTGAYEVSVENAYIRYEFVIRRNITVIRGQSATGKTTLFEMIRAYNEQEESGIQVKCEKTLAVLYGKDWEKRLGEIENSIVFIDEQSRFVKSADFARKVRGSDNYYVIITREKMPELPYSVTEIYGIRTRGKYAGLAGEYATNEFYRIYGERPMQSFKPDVIITEDSNAGYEFWNGISDSVKCVSAGGKSNIIKKLKELKKTGQRYLAIVDGAAFGAELEEVLQYIRFGNPEVEIFAPESFEYLLLSGGLFPSAEIKEKCKNTADHADSVRYMSWEQFYTELITEATKDTEMQYSKKKLNLYYLSERNKKIIMEQVPEQLRLLSK